MKLETIEIISVLKDNHTFKTDGSYVDAVMSYMADRCACDKSCYNAGDVFQTIQRVVVDYLEGCSNPHSFMKNVFEHYNMLIGLRAPLSEIEMLSNSLMSALVMVEVKENGKFVNGFDERIYVKITPSNKYQTSKEPKTFNLEEYTIEYCPFCDGEQVIYSKGVTACPDCGKPLAPCSVCENCDYSTCPYECDGSPNDDHLTVTNKPISREEIEYVRRNIY